MKLKYGNICIRNAEREDAHLLCKWWNDGEVMAHAGFPLGLGITEDEILAKLQQESDETTRRHIIVIDKIPVGEMNYRRLNETACEMGIKICEKAYQNKGYGTKILCLFIDGLFRICKYQRILLDTNLENKRAQHVYEKLGFEKLRINENAWQDQLGKYQSSVDYALDETKFRNFLVMEA